jgi:D-alanyl-D-alanine endopeptidase (penicillin-binding protein 7)
MNAKTCRTLLAAMAFGAAAFGGTPIRNAPLPQLGSAAALVQDQATGECLVAKQADVIMPIASITKLMTAMVILDAPINMDEQITIEEEDKDKLRFSRSRLPVGTVLTRRQALALALMASENRAAHALARTFPGGLETFVASMNAKARSLELTQTCFVDPTGLSEDNVANATDLVRMVEAAYQYTRIRTDSTQTSFRFRSGRREFTFGNSNALVRNPRWRIGLSKTGYIEEGGRCLVMQTRLARRPVVMVLLNASGNSTRIQDALRIKQWMEGPEPRPRKSRRAPRRGHRA